MIYQQKQSNRLRNIMICLGVVLVTALIAVGSNLFPPSSNIRTIGVEIYTDANQTTRLTSINWGTLAPGENKTVLAYIKNVNNTIATLALNTSDWQPINASNFIALTWNYTDTPLPPNALQSTTFTLHVKPKIENIDAFTFIMTITATEA